MATALNTGSPTQDLPAIRKDAKVAIVSTLWNSHITDRLARGAEDVLKANGVDYDTYRVPGAVELVYAASRLNCIYDAVIIIGCVIRGDTPHFDYVCKTVTDGTTRLNADALAPVIFGVLTVNNEQQALDRADGVLGNKGAEAAEAAIHMIAFTDNLTEE